MRVAVAQLTDVADGSVQEVVAGSRKLVLIRRGGEFFAIRNICPHQGAPLCRGVLSGVRPSGSVGDYRLERVGEILRCPWHNWEFDVTDGRCLHSPKKRVATYSVDVADGKVWVTL